MKKLLLALGILALICSPAMAGRNANGAMVLHTNDAVRYSPSWDYCANNPLPTTCEQLVTQTNAVPEELEAVIWVVGAFDIHTSPGVNAYQFGLYHNLPTGYFTAWSPCDPTALEVKDATWPDESGTGTAVAYGSPVYPHFLFKMYWFAVVGQAGTVFSTGVYPHGTDGAAFADDSSPPIVDRCNRFGTVRWGAPGANECPFIPTQGACCYPDGRCQFVEPTQCSGVFLGIGVPCDPNPCPLPGACCFGTECVMVLESACVGQGGTWVGGDCTPVTCAPLGACCVGEVCSQTHQADCQGTYVGDGVPCDPNPCIIPTGACCIGSDCTVTTQAGCDGTYMGDGIPCDPNPCATPTKPTTWGKIKGNYR